ncbi:hypothetical protein H7827_01360 [Streptomyces sp. JH002]|uniref:hypothetical protein n=1 Tax=Streptomyces sp. JH002 TaxID=2763259 RepID=UPI003D8026C9
MPTIEFHGYRAEAERPLAEEVRNRLAPLPFAPDIVLSLGTREVVEDLSGRPRPFLRVLTRSVERASHLLQELRPIADVEIVLINFFERKPS